MKLPYSEGSVFLVPLRKGGYARGVVARMSPKGKILFGYFFSPRLMSSENVPLNDIDPKNAVAQLMCGDLGLLRGDWKVCGKAEGWERSNWPMPDFITRIPHPKTGKVWLTRYADDDPARVMQQVPVDPSMNYPIDSLSGQSAVEIKLDKIIGGIGIRLGE